MDDQPSVYENVFLWVVAGMFFVTAACWICLKGVGLWWEAMKRLVRYDDAKYGKK